MKVYFIVIYYPKISWQSLLQSMHPLTISYFGLRVIFVAFIFIISIFYFYVPQTMN